MAINMEYLSHFIVGAEYHNFTLAAEQLFMSQSTLSRQIKDLEEEFGVPLFIRNGKTVELTKAGQALYDAGRPLLAHVEQVTNLVTRVGSYKEQRVNVYSVPGYFDALTEAYRRLKQVEPTGEVVLRHMQQQDPVALLESDSMDFLITYDVFLQENLNYIRIPFSQEHFCAVCSPDHPLTRYETVTLGRCLQENVFFGKDLPISLLGGRRSFASGDLPEGGLTMTLESSYSPIRLGKGIVILPSAACRSYAAGLCYIPISNPELSHRAVLVYKKNAPLSRAAKAYAEIVRDIGRENGLG